MPQFIIRLDAWIHTVQKVYAWNIIKVILCRWAVIELSCFIIFNTNDDEGDNSDNYNNNKAITTQ